MRCLAPVTVSLVILVGGYSTLVQGQDGGNATAGVQDVEQVDGDSLTRSLDEQVMAFIPGISELECWLRCERMESCQTAVYEAMAPGASDHVGCKLLAHVEPPRMGGASMSLFEPLIVRDSAMAEADAEVEDVKWRQIGRPCKTTAWASCGDSQKGAQCCPAGFYCQPWNPLYYQCMNVPTAMGTTVLHTDMAIRGRELTTLALGSVSACYTQCTQTTHCRAITFENVPRGGGGPRCTLYDSSYGMVKCVGAVACELTPPRMAYEPMSLSLSLPVPAKATNTAPSPVMRAHQF